MKRLTHINDKGEARMVDISEKPSTARAAIAGGHVSMKRSTLRLILADGIAKGDVIGTARIAGIMAAKKTHEMIPLCHPISISSIEIEFNADRKDTGIAVRARVTNTGQTGVEMEALTAVSAAALTIYDMCKAVDREMVISKIMLLEKTGGRSGTFRRNSRA